MKRLSVLLAVAFVDMMGLMIVVPQLPFYAQRFGASPSIIGLLVAAFPVAQLAASPVWGRLSDHYGRRPVLLAGLSASAVAYLIFAFADSLPLLFLSRIAQGLGGGMTGVAQAYVADTMAPRERAKALGWLSAATSAGVVIGPFLGSLSVRFGYAAPGLVAAALVVGNLAFAWASLPESRRRHTPPPGGMPESRPAGRSIKTALWEVIRHPGRPAAQVIWIYVVAMLAYNAVPPVFALYLNRRFGVTEETIGYFFVVFGAVGVLMRATLVGWVNQRLGEVRTMRLGAVLYGLGFALCPLAPTVALFVAAQILLPLGTALLFPATSALVSHRAPHHEMGLTMGVQQTFRGVSSVVGPLSAGVAYERLGPSVPFFACAAILAFATLLAWRVRQDAPAEAASD